MKRGQKTATTVSVMEANRGKSYDEIGTLIAEALGAQNGTGRLYYRYMVEAGKVQGFPAPWMDGTATKAPKAPKAPKVKEDIHAASNRMIAKAIASGNLPMAVNIEKSAADIASIKAKNLETMKKVSAKAKKVKVIDTSADEVATVDLSDEDVYADRELIKGLVPKEFHRECGLL
jgi:hypothetical protein